MLSINVGQLLFALAYLGGYAREYREQFLSILELHIQSSILIGLHYEDQLSGL